MSKEPSAATQLRSAKREIKRLRAELTAARASENQWKVKAIATTQAVADWKHRFDMLLARCQVTEAKR